MRLRRLRPIALLLVIAGCATVPPREAPAPPSPRSSVTPVVPLRAPSLVPSPTGRISAPTDPARGIDRLTLADALALSDRLHPELAVSQAQIARAEGRALQAGLFPNPELVARIESAPLTEHLTEQAEYVVGVSQAVPLGKRLPLARRVELLDRDRLTHELTGKRVEIHMRVQSAFATALYWQRVIQTREEDVRSATNNVTLAKARLAAGDIIPAEVAHAEVELRQAQLERDKATSSAAQSVNALAAAMGDAALDVQSLDGVLEEALVAPPLSSLTARLDASPLLMAAAADIAVQRAQMDLVESQRTPDVTVDLFYRRLGESDNALDVGVRLPLRLFDRGQGRRQETRAELSAAEARTHVLRNELFLGVKTAHQKLESAIAAVTRLREDILPRAESVLRAAEARYRAGDTGFSELLPVRRDWTRVRLEYLETLHEVMQAWAALSPYVWQE